MSVGGVGGNTSVEVSVNGQEFTEGSGIVVELVGGMNVSSVSQSAVVHGSAVQVRGSGFSAVRGVHAGDERALIVGEAPIPSRPGIR